MTAADALRSTSTAARRYRYGRCCAVLTVVAAVWTAASSGWPRGATAAAAFQHTTSVTADEPLVVTFEGGETATAPPDDTVYLTEEVATLNATARDAGDYAYDDEYDSATDRTDVKPVAGGRTHLSVKPSKPPVKPIDVTAADEATDAAPTAVITAVPASTVAAIPTADVSEVPTADVSEVPTAVVSEASPVTITDSVRPNQTDALTAVETTTESGILMQMAIPPTTSTAAVTATTTPMSDTSSPGTASSARSTWSQLFVACLAVTTAVAFSC
ncbi:Hypothetical protein CINCED_3A009364 [Cinara cedri]|uniref:Uncharacterized protein n=1 Tax=Cinara cedri TaxID=506608 RepID=A0A5E4NLU7_9HEMI|nr:Hypothetical protein CINCED_3A009364 [Cinara cedri]